MKFLDVLFGRTKPVKPNLDALFSVPSAATTLDASLGLVPTGLGAVCFKSVEGPSAARAQADALALVAADIQARATVTQDEYGYTWIASERKSRDLSALVTDLHAVNSTLADAGDGPSLLCTIIEFSGKDEKDARRLMLVYLYKRGTYYPFAPNGPQVRDTSLEMSVRAQLKGDLPIETDLNRWFPIWGAPGL
ncbi:MAG: hypothetical protein H0T78_04300 [Longispora sp.]|nr:hypothetical protein [Longispora sp. (in: high G+C Gram-positive bacteria)]